MNDYLNFQSEDFAKDEYFIYWVKSTDILAETFWQNWLETYPFKRNDVEIARQLVLLTQQLPEQQISDGEITALKDSIFNRIESIENNRTANWRTRTWWAAAALISGILFFTGWYGFQHRSTSATEYTKLITQASEKYELIEVENDSKSIQVINLPDGSSVILKKGSKLAYPNHFWNSKREVFLTGEAFFEIIKNAEKPFYVHSNEIVTKVLGTSFTVRAYREDKEIVVTVKTGKVSVYKAGKMDGKFQHKSTWQNGVILEPEQRAVFIRKTIKNNKEPISAEVIPVKAQIDQMLFEYQDKPVGEVFDELERAYDIHIVYDKDRLAKCPVTASLTGEPLNEKLKLLCKAVRVKYEFVDDKIVIYGRGCE